MGDALRAAVIGGSGFGKFHAQWYAAEGAEVVAYSCTSEESAAGTGPAMRELTGQEPRGYTDVAAMLAAERPDVVSVCTPPRDHCDPTLLALAAGAHVLCEKPIAFERVLNSQANLAVADRMVQAAAESGRVLAVNLQYAAALDPFSRLYERHRGAPLADFHSFSFEMESKGNRHGRHTWDQLWVELGPHALMPALEALPLHDLNAESIRGTMSEEESVIEFDFVGPGAGRVRASLRAGACDRSATPIRRFGFNGFEVDLLARRDEAGRPRSALRPAGTDEETEGEDFMRASVRRFLAAAKGEGSPLVTGDRARRNLDMTLRILDRLLVTRRSGEPANAGGVVEL